MIIVSQCGTMAVDTTSVFLYVEGNLIVAESYIPGFKRVLGIYDSPEAAKKALTRKIIVTKM